MKKLLMIVMFVLLGSCVRKYGGGGPGHGDFRGEGRPPIGWHP